MHCPKRQSTQPPPPRPCDWEAILSVLWPDATLRLSTLSLRAKIRIELYLVVEYHENTQVFEFHVSQRGLAWHELRAILDHNYPFIERVTGSKLPGLIGCNRHTSVPYDVWRGWTGQLRPGETMKVEANDTMDYGTHYEPRLRQILRMLIGDVREPGFFLMAFFQLMGVSPDGVTKRLVLHAIEHSLDSYGRKQTRAVVMHLGYTVVELKCSPYGLKHCIQIEHMIQVHQEMYVCGKRKYAWLKYWHMDMVCLFLVEFCPEFWDWVERRRDAFIAACRTKTELSKDSRVALGHRIQEEWFVEQRWRPTPRPAEMRTCFPPKRPKYWLVFLDDHSRSDAIQKGRLFNDREVYPVDHADDSEWYRNTWKPLGAEHWECPKLGPHLPLALEVKLVEQSDKEEW